MTRSVPTGPTFLDLVKHNLPLVKDAVAEATSPYETLHILSMGGRDRPARQLVDAIRYYGWSTAHWDAPVAMKKPLRNFDSIVPSDRGQFGYRFQSIADEVLAQVVAGRDDATYYTEEQLPALVQAVETTLGLVGESLPLDPWDGAIWLPAQRKVIVLEVKSTSHKLGRLKKQLEKRTANLELWRSLGINVHVVCVLGGRRFLDPSHSIHKFGAEYGCTVVNLEALENAALAPLLNPR